MAAHRESQEHRLEGAGEVRATLAILLSATAAAALLLVAGIQLKSQGLQYDEIHQAPAAFAYIGRPHTMFTRLAIHGIPVLNMSYSGAIKSAIYGFYMRVTGRGFGVLSWRLTGLLIVATGIVAFGVVARRAWTAFGLAVFLGLLVSDSTVLILSRFDWGPVALALTLRVLMLGIWLRGTLRESVPSWFMFWLGLLLGIAVFEKLVAVTLVVPLVLLIALGWPRVSPSQWIAGAVGLVVGSVPLLVANCYSYHYSGALISLADLTSTRQPPRVAPARFVLEYLSLGQGAPPRRMMFGAAGWAGGAADKTFVLAEAATIAGMLIVAAIAALTSRDSSRTLRQVGVLTLSYAAIGAALLLMPRSTLVHHWLFGTPLQYAAIALFIDHGRTRAARDEPVPAMWKVAVGGGVLLAILRAVSVLSLIGVLVTGAATTEWDPSLTVLGRFAAAHADNSVFVAADWGVATQIFCLGQGQSDLVFEAYSSYSGLPRIERWIAQARKRIVYVVTLWPISNNAYPPGTSERILRDFSASPHWTSAPLDPELAGLESVHVVKFVPSR
jgi:hypothetical protein